MPTTPTNGKIKVYTLLDANAINSNTRTDISKTIATVCNAVPTEIKVFDGVVVDFFDSDIANVSTEKTRLTKKQLLKLPKKQ